MVFEKVVQILAEQLSVDPDKITMESMLEEDLDADSLDAIDIVRACHYQIRWRYCELY